MIKLQNVNKVFTLSKESEVRAIADISLEIQSGEFLIITGRSGTGKTTLLNLIAGLTRPTTGEVFFEGVNIWTLSDRHQSILRNQKFGFIFQFPSLLPYLNVLDNTCLPTIFGVNHTQPESQQRALELLDKLGLADKQTSYPRQLSAGQQQRVVIARALLNQPEVLLADEPTSDLDEQTEIEIMELFREIHQNTSITIVLVTHSSQLVHYGTRSIRMTKGKIIEGGT